MTAFISVTLVDVDLSSLAAADAQTQTVMQIEVSNRSLIKIALVSVEGKTSVVLLICGV